MRRDPYKRYVAAGITAFCVIAASILVFFLFYHAAEIRAVLSMLGRVLRPIFLGMVIAFLLLPVHRFLLHVFTAMTPNERLKDERNLRFLNMMAIICSLFLAVLLLYLLLAMVVPQVYESVVKLVEDSSKYILNLQNWTQAFLENNPDIQAAIMPVLNSAADSLEQWLNSEILPNLESVSAIFQWARTTLWPNFTSVMTGVSGMLVGFLVLVKDLLIALIVSVYLLARKDIFAAQSKKIVYSLFPTRTADLLVEETRDAYRIMSGFINGKLLDSLIIGIICLICCYLFRFPYPALIATVVGVTNIVPFFGPFIGAIPCGLLIFLVSPLQCLYFAVFILALQQFDGNILGPKILGESTGLASFWVLFSILLFGGVFGFAGMVLGVPVFAMFYSVVRRTVHWGLRQRHLPEDTDFYLGRTEALAGAARKEPPQEERK